MILSLDILEMEWIWFLSLQLVRINLLSVFFTAVMVCCGILSIHNASLARAEVILITMVF
jgi:hypothetical protein